MLCAFFLKDAPFRIDNFIATFVFALSDFQRPFLTPQKLSFVDPQALAQFH
jgi:hypothetical protein